MIDLPAEYLRAGNLDHAYSLNIHKAQGSTAREAFVLADRGFDRERGYTALSRGTESSHLYLDDESIRVEDCHAPELEPTVIERALADLATSHADKLALDLDDELVLGL